MNKIVITPLIIFFNLFLVEAQPHIQWQKTYGGSGNDYASEIIITNDGGYMLAGFSESNDSDVTVNYGGRDWWIVKIDNVGGIQWQKSLGGSADEFLESIFQTSDGGYILSGYTESNDSDVTFNHGHRDCWIVKLDSAGNIERQKCFGGSDFEIAYSIMQTPEGGYIFTGYTNSQDGDLTTSNSAQDYWVVKLDTSFNIEWQHRYGGQYSDESFSIQPTSDSGYIITGYSNSSNGHVTGHNGMQDGWVVKINNLGSLQWQKSLGGSSNESSTFVEETSDGGFIVTATTASNDSDVTGNHGSADLWIVKLDSSGSILSQKTYGGSGNDGAYSFQSTTDGGYILAGYSTSNDGDVTGNNGDYDYWIVRLDSTGTLLWQKSLGGTGIESAFSILQSTDGGFIVLGNTVSDDGDVTGNHGGNDYWIVKLDSSENVGVKGIQNSISDFQVSPNPFSDEMIISFRISSNENVKIEISDIEGRLIKKIGTGNLNGYANKILWNGKTDDGSSVVDGIYFVTISTDKFRESKKIVLLRN